MSFLLDAILLFVIGALSRRILKDSYSRRLILAVALMLFWMVGGLLYLDVLSIPLLGEYGEGNHFMWNSGIEILGLNALYDPPLPTYIETFGIMNLLAILIFATYPLWLFAGTRF